MTTARNVLTKAVADVIARVGNLIAFPIMAHCAGRDGYGAWGQINTVVGFIIPFATLGLSGAMVRFYSTPAWTRILRSGLMRILLISGLLSLCAGVVIAFGADALNGLFLKWEFGTPLFQWGATLVAAGAFQQLLLDFLRAREMIVGMSLLQILETVATVGAIAVLKPSGYGLVELVQVVLIIKLVIIAIIIIGIFGGRIRSESAGGEASPSMRAMMRFGLPVVVAGLGLWMMNLGDRLVIGHWMNAGSLGLYNAIYSAAALLVALNAPLNMPLYPRLMKAIESRDPQKVAFEVITFHRYTNLILVPGAFFLILITRPLLLLLGGGAFEADTLLAALIVGGLFLDQWNSVAQYALLCSDRSMFNQNAWICAGALNVAANLIAVPYFGLRGAAFVTFASYLVVEIVFFFKAQQVVPVLSLYQFKVALKAFAASAAASAGVLIIWKGNIAPTVINILECSAVFGVIYFLSVLALREIRNDDLAKLARALFLKK